LPSDSHLVRYLKQLSDPKILEAFYVELISNEDEIVALYEDCV